MTNIGVIANFYEKKKKENKAEQLQTYILSRNQFSVGCDIYICVQNTTLQHEVQIYTSLLSLVTKINVIYTLDGENEEKIGKTVDTHTEPNQFSFG